MQVAPLPDRLAALAEITLKKGSHARRSAGMCAMEAVAWLADEKHTDSPACVSKTIQLCGGRPTFDQTVLAFARWGMGSATPLLLSPPTASGMTLLARADEFAAPIPGREHHASWCAGIDHPDARLIEKAPDLLALVAEVSESECAQCIPGDPPCGECLECRARALLRALAGEERAA